MEIVFRTYILFYIEVSLLRYEEICKGLAAKDI